MGGWTPRWVGASDRPNRVILLTLLIGLFGYIDAVANAAVFVLALYCKLPLYRRSFLGIDCPVDHHKEMQHGRMV